MQTSKIFWGVFFLVLGILYLLNNYINLSDFLDQLWKLWPIILILIGLKIFFSNKTFKLSFNILFAIILSLFIYSFVFHPFNCMRFNLKIEDGKEEIISQSYLENIKEGELNISFDIGEINIAKSNDKMIYGKAKSVLGNYFFDGEILDSKAKYELKLKENKIVIKNKLANYSDLKLGEKIPWTIKSDLNFCKFNWNLKQIKLLNLDLISNLSEGTIKLNSVIDSTKINLKLNLSKTKIYLEDSVGYKIKANLGLSKLKADNVIKINSHEYQSENFESASKKIFISIDSNLSNITIEQ